MIRILRSQETETLLKRRAERLAEAEAVVRPILDDLRVRGDEALLEYARRFDGLDRSHVVSPSELRQAHDRLAPELRKAVATAAENIRAFAQAQLPQPKVIELRPGLSLGQIVRPLDVAAAYIPSGRYPLVSTLMMTVIPAKVAGVGRICVASPLPGDAVLGVASMLGVAEVFRMGGAHAIAAFAFGTATVPKADRIVGPGNIYVAAAKKLLAGEVGIDFVAGPSEILILAESGDACVLAADMLAQAEHDSDAAAVLLTTSQSLAEAVRSEIERQIASLPTAAVAAQSITRNGAILLVRSLDEGIEIANRFAPEHLSISDAGLLGQIQNAGSVFVGAYSPEAAGDYASGPNHVLPTGGAARIRGGLSSADFVKVISVQQLSRDALAELAPPVVILARAEGLEAHARSVEVRFHD
jgi:histidinol dehydrogenase